MFVSSYSTYIQTNNSDKVAKQRLEKPDLGSKAFSSKLNKEVSTTRQSTSSVPVDYISKNVVLHNKQELEKQHNKLKDLTQEKLSKFSGKSSMIQAQSAYEGNKKMFSLFQVPHIALKQTPSLQNTLPHEPMDIKELNMRHTMVNTYITNDNYYRITA